MQNLYSLHFRYLLRLDPVTKIYLLRSSPVERQPFLYWSLHSKNFPRLQEAVQILHFAWSCIFMYCMIIFCSLIRQLHVMHFQVMHFQRPIRTAVGYHILHKLMNREESIAGVGSSDAHWRMPFRLRAMLLLADDVITTSQECRHRCVCPRRPKSRWRRCENDIVWFLTRALIKKRIIMWHITLNCAMSLYKSINQSINHSVSQSVCLSVRPSVRPSIQPSIHPSIYLSIYKNWWGDFIPPNIIQLISIIWTPKWHW